MINYSNKYLLKAYLQTSLYLYCGSKALEKHRKYLEFYFVNLEKQFVKKTSYFMDIAIRKRTIPSIKFVTNSFLFEKQLSF